MSSDSIDKAGPNNSPPSTDSRKLRLSCDSCHAAKVKCGKERPLCSRCANSGSSCVYSKSRRAGKPKGCGKKSASFAKLPTPPELSSQPDSPLSDARMSMDFDESPWSADTIPGPRPASTLSTLNHNFTTLPAATELPNSLDPTLTQNPFPQRTFNPNATMESEESFESAFSNANMFTTDFKMSPDWVSNMDATGNQIPFSTESMATCTASNVMLYPDFTSDGSTLDDSSSGMGTSPPSCNCPGALQDILSALNASIPSFDKFLAINKSAVLRMTHCLSCHCLPDISSVMLLSVIITRIVQCYKKIRNGESRGFEEVGVTMGMLKMDSEDEYQIKMVLIRSELRKIKSLVTRFRDRFENFLQGADRQLYEANMTFLEFGLDDTIKDL